MPSQDAGQRLRRNHLHTQRAVRGLTMRTDPIVEEARQAGQKYADSFNGDWKALADDLNRRAQEEGRQRAWSRAVNVADDVNGARGPREDGREPGDRRPPRI